MIAQDVVSRRKFVGDLKLKRENCAVVRNRSPCPCAVSLNGMVCSTSCPGCSSCENVLEIDEPTDLHNSIADSEGSQRQSSVSFFFLNLRTLRFLLDVLHLQTQMCWLEVMRPNRRMPAPLPRLGNLSLETEIVTAFFDCALVFRFRAPRQAYPLSEFAREHREEP